MADDSGSGMGMGMIIGILVVVLVVFLLFFGRGFMGGGGTQAPSGGGTGGSLDVNVKTPGQ